MNIEATQNQNKNVSTGVRLRNAREQLGLSQQAIAERLCLKVSIIRDIEEDKSPSDLALTFLRGYIRSYAKLVHVPENELFLPEIEKKTPVRVVKISPIQFLSFRKYRTKYESWIMILFWIMLFMITSVIGSWYWKKCKPQKEKNITISNQSFSELNGSVNGKIANFLLDSSHTLSSNE